MSLIRRHSKFVRRPCVATRVRNLVTRSSLTSTYRLIRSSVLTCRLRSRPSRRCVCTTTYTNPSQSTTLTTSRTAVYTVTCTGRRCLLCTNTTIRSSTYLTTTLTSHTSITSPRRCSRCTTTSAIIPSCHRGGSSTCTSTSSTIVSGRYQSTSIST